MRKVKSLLKRFISYYGDCMTMYGEGIMRSHGCGAI